MDEGEHISPTKTRLERTGDWLRFNFGNGFSIILCHSRKSGLYYDCSVIRFSLVILSTRISRRYRGTSVLFICTLMEEFIEINKRGIVIVFLQEMYRCKGFVETHSHIGTHAL